MPLRRLFIIALLQVSALAVVAGVGQFNRAIGQYPGNPTEFFGPTLVSGGEYRNLALNRMVRQSSSWDFNLTAQLLTDGVIETVEPAWLSVTTPNGEVPIHKREAAIDGNDWTCNVVMGNDTWLQYDWHGMSIDLGELQMMCSMAYYDNAPHGFTIRLLTSSDGIHWHEADVWTGDSLPGTVSRRRVHSDPNKSSGDDDLLPTRNINHTFRVGVSFSYLRLEMKVPAAVHWTITELLMRKNGCRARGVLPATHFVSAWRSATGHDEWVSIDLGAPSLIDKVNLHWLSNPQQGIVEVSDDEINWHDVASLDYSSQIGLQELSLSPITCRYVRLKILDDDNCNQVCISEIEVMGKGGVTIVPHSPVGWQNGKWMLDGGDWRLQRASLVTDEGNTISSIGFNADEWLVATVPATVLSSYVNAGALPDMNYDDNLLLASESWFNGDFWYRRTFDLPDEMNGRRVMLNLEGINWKADVWLNGEHVDCVEGAFKRGKYDITSYLKPTDNVLAIRIIANANPGGVKLKTEKNTDFNGGILGADNPTFHATIGWDWISTIRGRDIGIWDDVYLTVSGDITLSDPVVTTVLTKDDTIATITPAVMLTNHSSGSVSGTLSGYIGDIRFERNVTIAANSQIEVSFSPSDYAQLRDQRMRLWWPNGYGEPYLYDAGFSFTKDGVLDDSIHYRAGIREVTIKDKETKLLIYVNHQRIEPLGGNWAFSENNLNYRGREFDAAVRYHREMNYNMIRNWVGMTGDREFYEACDRYGIMVWQDFWLANPADGPDPDDESMFMDNARDLVMKIRQHPCVTIYCGRNEGYPPKTLDDGLRQTVSTMHPGLDYISSSADDGVSGHGPYHALRPEEYFIKQTGKLHTERGMPCMMTFEGLSRTLNEEHIWPQNTYWGRHDFTQEGAQRGAEFNKLIEQNFGQPQSVEEFTKWSQWINYEGYRAMYESTSHDRIGLLIWMSHPCWPSMVWQTYDYYLEPTAAYFGVKHACEPLHVQWNPVSNRVEIINRSAGQQHGIVKAMAISLDGKEIWSGSKPYNCDSDTTLQLMSVAVPSDFSGVYIMRLTLTDAQGRLRSQNDYVGNNVDGDRTALRTMPNANVEAIIQKSNTRANITLTNTGSIPAMMLRLNLKGSDGEQILPVIYSDNYIHLLPGEHRIITIEWNHADTRGTAPQIEISGTNLPQMTVF